MYAAASGSTVEFPRKFVAPDVHFGEWANAEPYYCQLAERPIRSAAEFEQWLFDWSELDSGFDEEGVRRRVEMTCQTDDPQRERAFLYFIENVHPQREPWQHKLRQRYAQLIQQFPLPARRYEVLTRAVRNALDIYRDENVPLLTEDAKLQQQYQKTVGAMTVHFRGEEMTLQKLALFLEEPDRKVREEAWRLGADRFLKDGDALDALYDQMVALRDRIGRNAGCRDYREYMFKARERFDYTPEDCLAFHDAIEKVCVPAVQQLAAERKHKLNLPSLRPWDFEVDPDKRPPLRPFDSVERLSEGCSNIFARVGPDFRRIYERMRTEGMLDLASRKGKAPGGYQETYWERRMPFIFMNAVGTERDVETLLHEGGHAFHTFACRNDPLAAYRNYPIEFAEVASMGMECLALPHLEEFYGADSNRARRRFFEGIVKFFPWMSRVDAFQHYVYTHVDHDPQRRNDEWVKLSRRFDPQVDWSGLEPYERRSWHRKLHFFEVPFYYVEYGIAQLGALQVWQNSRKDYAEAVALYQNGLTLGGSRPLPELFAAAGLKFDFSEKTLRPLIGAVMDEIARLA